MAPSLFKTAPFNSMLVGILMLFLPGTGSHGTPFIAWILSKSYWSVSSCLLIARHVMTRSKEVMMMSCAGVTSSLDCLHNDRCTCTVGAPTTCRRAPTWGSSYTYTCRSSYTVYMYVYIYMHHMIGLSCTVLVLENKHCLYRVGSYHADGMSALAGHPRTRSAA